MRKIVAIIWTLLVVITVFTCLVFFPNPIGNVIMLLFYSGISIVLSWIPYIFEKNFI